MKTLYRIVFLIVIIGSYVDRVDAKVAKDNATSATRFCNYFLTSTCFEINNKNTVSLSIPADYLLYKVSFDNDLYAVIYEGFWPMLENKVLALEYEKCSIENKKCAFFKENENAVEAIYRPSSKEDSIHIVIHNISNKNHQQAMKFLNTFKSCKYTNLSRICNDSALFNSELAKN